MKMTFYRGGCLSSMPNNKTAWDILYYEWYVLGNNDVKLVEDIEKDALILSKIKSENLI